MGFWIVFGDVASNTIDPETAAFISYLTAIVSTIGGMYFVTAAMISIVALGEPLSIQKAVGIGLAIVAMVVINQYPVAGGHSPRDSTGKEAVTMCPRDAAPAVI